MVRCQFQRVSSNRINFLCFYQQRIHIECRFLSLCHIVHQVVKFPAIVAVESFVQQIHLILIFGQHINRFDRIERCAGCFPKISRHTACIIAAVSVNICVFHPEFQRMKHGIAHILIVVIQIGHVRPVGIGWNDISQRILRIPVFVFSNPLVVPTGVVSNPVEQHLEAHFVGLVHQCFKIVQRSKFRINSFIISNGIIRSQWSFPVFFGNRINRHEPKNIYTQFFQAGQRSFERFKGAFRSVLTNINFIHNRIFAPFRNIWSGYVCFG